MSRRICVEIITFPEMPLRQRQLLGRRFLRKTVLGKRLFGKTLLGKTLQGRTFLAKMRLDVNAFLARTLLEEDASVAGKLPANKAYLEQTFHGNDSSSSNPAARLSLAKCWY